MRTNSYVSLIAMFAISACAGEGTAPSSGCTPGETQSCLCVGGGEGVQACLSDKTFGPCDCGTTDAGATDAGAVDTAITDASAPDASAPDASAADSLVQDARSKDVDRVIAA